MATDHFAEEFGDTESYRKRAEERLLRTFAAICNSYQVQHGTLQRIFVEELVSEALREVEPLLTHIDQYREDLGHG